MRGFVPRTGFHFDVRATVQNTVLGWTPVSARSLDYRARVHELGRPFSHSAVRLTTLPLLPLSFSLFLFSVFRSLTLFVSTEIFCHTDRHYLHYEVIYNCDQVDLFKLDREKTLL